MKNRTIIAPRLGKPFARIIIVVKRWLIYNYNNHKTFMSSVNKAKGLSSFLMGWEFLSRYRKQSFRPSSPGLLEYLVARDDYGLDPLLQTSWKGHLLYKQSILFVNDEQLFRTSYISASHEIMKYGVKYNNWCESELHEKCTPTNDQLYVLVQHLHSLFIDATICPLLRLRCAVR